MHRRAASAGLGRSTGASPPTTTARPATSTPSHPSSPPPSPKSWAAASTSPLASNSSIRLPPGVDSPGSRASSRPGWRCSAASTAHAFALSNAVLREVEPGSQESDHALLNLATMHLHAGNSETRPRVRAQAPGIDEQRRAPALHRRRHGTARSPPSSGGSLETSSKQLMAMAEPQRGITPPLLRRHHAQLAIVCDRFKTTRDARSSTPTRPSRHSRRPPPESRSRRPHGQGDCPDDARRLGSSQRQIVISASTLGQTEAIARASRSGRFCSGDPDGSLSSARGRSAGSQSNVNDRSPCRLQSRAVPSRRRRSAC